MQDKVLVLGEHCKTMSIEVLRKLDELAKAGAVICGIIPETPAGLTDSQEEFDRLVADVWKSGRPNVFKSKLADVLKDNGVEPDFVYSAPADIKFVHRSDGDREIYWVRNFSDNAVDAQLKLRDAKGVLTVYNPETGKILPDAISAGKLQLEANQALFVVADKNGTPAPAHAAPEIAGAVALNGPWKVAFDGVAAPEGIRTFDKLISYTESDDPAMKYFSGIATYTNTFTLKKKQKAKGLFIDLGEVGQMADVFINGEHVAFLWKAPYRVEWTGTMKRGVNTIKIRVINTWPNRLIGDAQPGAEKHSYTTMPFYRADSPLTPSGLMGPVSLVLLKK